MLQGEIEGLQEDKHQVSPSPHAEINIVAIPPSLLLHFNVLVLPEKKNTSSQSIDALNGQEVLEKSPVVEEAA